ncbi:hypothetical protein [Cochleicola gelatinilyticus]|nr:hypothetical protein [Cochleicola gelatinilyticus]
MNIKKILLFIISITIFGCGCNDDGFESFELTEFERSLIPFTTEQNVQFINQESELLDATITAKTIDNFNLNSSDDESCMVTLVESHRNQLILNGTGQDFFVFVQKSRNLTEFIITSGVRDFAIDGCETNFETIVQATTNYTSDGFSFENVFILENCGTENLISTFIYSSQNGIEFIKYDNGNYLKQVE